MSNPSSGGAEPLAKLAWQHPETGEVCEYILCEGATASIGRSSNNDIQIAEQHVSRQHAVITYRDGMFVVSDLGSSNGTYVNEQRVDKPYPLFAGDVIRLHVPTVQFLSIESMDDIHLAEATGRILLPTFEGSASLMITNGPQEGQSIPLLLDHLQIGRATTNATWEILLQDPSVSRPHARLEKQGKDWVLYDLDSRNGSSVNNVPLEGEDGITLNDGDTVRIGATMMLFRWSGT